MRLIVVGGNGGVARGGKNLKSSIRYVLCTSAPYGYLHVDFPQHLPNFQQNLHKLHLFATTRVVLEV